VLLQVEGVKDVEVDYSKAIIRFDPQKIQSKETLNDALSVYGYKLTKDISEN
jgi:copper chaperone CopZ